MMKLYLLQIFNSNEKNFENQNKKKYAYGITSNMFKILNRED